MDVAPTKEHKQLQKEIVAFAKQQLKDASFAERDRGHVFSRALWQACGAQRIPGLVVPEAYGGKGYDALGTAMALEGLGLAIEDQGLLMALSTHLLSCQVPLVAFGTEAQKQRFLPGLSDGSRIATSAMAEPVGSSWSDLATTAVADGDGYVITGEKTLLTNAPVADVVIVYAVTDAEKGAEGGITAFVLDVETAGIQRGPAMDTMGLHTAEVGSLVFDNVRVDAGAVLGQVGGGVAVFDHAMTWERSLLSAGQVGQMQTMLDQTIAYARARKADGKAISKYQSVSHKITDMKMRVEAARLLTYRAAWTLDQRPKEAALSASVNKVFVSEAYVKASLDAVQIMGGKGYLAASNMERLVRDSIGGTFYSGSNDVQRSAIAAELGL
ncbi:MAG: acyl-CoA dehydrogenase family protein [Rhodothermales bacterium]